MTMQWLQGMDSCMNLIEAFLWDIWEMLRKLLLTGVIVFIFPGKSFQVVFIALCNICFFAFLTIEKPHKPGGGRTLAFLSSFAITFTMLLGLVLKTVEDAQAYSGFLALLLIVVNCSVAFYTLKLIVTSLCRHRCARKKANITLQTILLYILGQSEFTAALAWG